jgi:aryl-alcohol dehydrogenase-like predicted oxidoreductase
MEYYNLAPDLKISRIVTGLWQIADMEKDGQPLDPVKTAAYLQPYVDAGLTSFDMADHYGSSEVITGVYRKNNKDQPVQLFTKWVPKPGKVTKKEVRLAVEKALERMQSTSIDLLQYHAWNYADASYLDQLFMLQELKEEGLIKHLGLTNFDAAHLRIVATSGIKVVSNQICFSLLDQRAAGDMASVCKEFGIGILAFGTLAGGFLSEKWLNEPEPNPEKIGNWSLMKYKRFIDAAGGWSKFQSLLTTLNELATNHAVSISNIASKYILEQPAVAAVIIGARLGESEHIAKNKKLLEFQLSVKEQNTIHEALSEFESIPGDCGDEYRKPPFLTASGDLSHHIDSLPAPFDTFESPNGIKVLSGTTWEKEFGYCRAIKTGDTIKVSGTTASHGNKLVGGNDPSAQTHFVIDKIEGALQSLGGNLEQVTRTRIFVQNLEDWEAIAKAHGNRFKDIQPANTLVQAKLVGEEFLVEIEAEAFSA